MPGDEEEVDDEEMGVAETYADYMPAKCKFINLVKKKTVWKFDIGKLYHKLMVQEVGRHWILP